MFLAPQSAEFAQPRFFIDAERQEKGMKLIPFDSCHNQPWFSETKPASQKA